MVLGRAFAVPDSGGGEPQIRHKALERLTEAEAKSPPATIDGTSREPRFLARLDADPFLPVVKHEFRRVQARVYQHSGLTLQQLDALDQSTNEGSLRGDMLTAWKLTSAEARTVRPASDAVAAYLDQKCAQAA